MAAAFQSAPPRGGRPIHASPWAHGCRSSFQSAPPRAGGDSTITPHRGDGLMQVSIRAPARGGRQYSPSIHDATFTPVIVSIRAPARGATKGWKPSLRVQRRRFQSAPPRGGRPGRRLRPANGTWSFNPRPRAGGDRPRRVRRQRTGVSIRAPARGATSASPCVRMCPGVFQSAPPRGGRRPPPRR